MILLESLNINIKPIDLMIDEEIHPMYYVQLRGSVFFMCISFDEETHFYYEILNFFF